MEAKHTPGPWNSQAHPPNECACLEGIFDAESNQIAMVYKSGHHLSMHAQRANARLIAAAPDMLDALERIAAVTPTEGKAARNRGAMLQMRALAEVAIAKATGAAA